MNAHSVSIPELENRASITPELPYAGHKPAARASQTAPSLFFFNTSGGNDENEQHSPAFAVATRLTPSPLAHLADAAPVIAAIGLTDARNIRSDGLTIYNTDIPNAFGGTLKFIHNSATTQALWDQGARSFAIRHRRGNDPAQLETASWERLLTEWTNYLYEQRYRPEHFKPWPDGTYKFSDPKTIYTIDALMFEWQTQGAPEMLHQFEIDFFNERGTRITAPDQRLTLRICNPAVEVAITGLSWAGKPVQPGQIVRMSSQYDSVIVTVRAFHPAGFLEGYQLVARYGSPVKSIDVLQDFFEWQRVRTQNWHDPIWQGVREQSVLFIPPVSATYELRLNALSRVTSGTGLSSGQVRQSLTIDQPFPNHEMSAVSSRHIEL